MKKSIYLSLFLFFVYSNLQAQQWSGSNSTTGNISRTGKVGIGTSNPVSPLEISSGGANTALQVIGTNSDAKWSGRIVAGGQSAVFVMGQYNNHVWLGAHNKALTSWADFYINPEGSSGKKVFIGAYGSRENTIFTVDNATGNSYFMNGNVGIGTSNPNNLLTIGNSGDGLNQLPTLRVQGQSITHSSGNRYGSYGSIILNSSSSYTAGARRYLITNAYELNKFAIIRSHNANADPEIGEAGVLTSGVVDFVINNVGNVGIGTTNPLARLNINQDGGAWNDGLRLNLRDHSWDIVSDHDGERLIISRDQNESQGIALHNGNVGIGNANPGYDLDVTGDINFTGNIYKNGVPFSGGGGSSLWSSATNGINFSGGNVGIGTDSPFKTLEIFTDKTKNSTIRLNSQASNSADEMYNTVWDIENDGYSSLMFKYAEYDNSSGLIQDPDVTTYFAISPNGISAPKFYDINNTKFFLDPSNTGTSLKVAGTIKTNTDVIIESNDDSPLVLDNTDGASQLISFYTNGAANNYHGDYRKAYMGVVNDYLVLNNKGYISINSGADIDISSNNIDINSNNFKVTGSGIVYAREVNVMTSAFPDYVFKPDYKLRSINEVEEYIKENQHLPGVPAEEEVVEKGINITEMTKIMMEKIEELTLYMIELKKENELLKAEIQSLK